MAGEFRIHDEAADDRMAGARTVWAYLPQMFVYPFTGFALPVLLLGAPGVWMLVKAALAFLSLDASEMKRWVSGVFLLIIVVVLLTHYILRVIEHTANGHALPPSLGGEVLTSLGRVFVQAIAYPICAVSLSLWLRGTAMAWPAAGLLLVLWPAHLMVMATERSVLAGLNPLRLLSAVAATGPLYLLVCVAVAGSGWVMLLLGDSHYALLSSALGFYLVLVICHLLGFIAYRRHHELGLDVEVRDPELKRQQQEQAQRLERLHAKIDAFMQGRNAEGAANEMFAEPGGPYDVLQFHEDLYTRLRTYKYGSLQLLQGQRLIGLLLQASRDTRALDIYEQCRSLNGHFEPESPRHLEKLAPLALSAGYDEMFLRMLRDVETRYPGDPIVVTGGLMEARYWAERKRDDGKALEVLMSLTKYEQHPQHRQVMSLLKVLRSS